MNDAQAYRLIAEHRLAYLVQRAQDELETLQAECEGQCAHYPGLQAIVDIARELQTVEVR